MPDILSKAVGKMGLPLMELDIERNDNLDIRLKLAPSLEALFRWAGSEQQSDRWGPPGGDQLRGLGGASFYSLGSTSTGRAPALHDFFAGLPYGNKFGQRLIDGDRPNVAILRTKGTSSDEGVRLRFEGVYSEEALKKLGLALRDVVVKLYKRFIRKVRVRASLVVEEVL